MKTGMLVKNISKLFLWATLTWQPISYKVKLFVKMNNWRELKETVVTNKPHQPRNWSNLWNSIMMITNT